MRESAVLSLRGQAVRVLLHGYGAFIYVFLFAPIVILVLFSFNATFPDAYAALLRFADWVWQGSLNALSAAGDTIPGALKLTNVARQGFSGHHYVIMALCSMVASFLVNAIFALAVDPRREESLPHEIA